MKSEDIIRQVLMHVAVIRENKAWEESRRTIISNILSNGLSFEETSKITGLTVEEISEIAKSQ